MLGISRSENVHKFVVNNEIAQSQENVLRGRGFGFVWARQDQLDAAWFCKRGKSRNE